VELGLVFVVDPAAVDESPRPGESPATYVERLAQEKASLVAERHPASLVLAADTTVELEGRILGKPADVAEALRMLSALAGRTHRVLTAVATAGRRRAVRTVETVVTFAPASREALTWYANSGEPLDKAGAYAVQGRGGFLVERVVGSHSSVIGLPLVETLAMLHAGGVQLPWEAR
jgi:septum formation protein